MGIPGAKSTHGELHQIIYIKPTKEPKRSGKENLLAQLDSLSHEDSDYDVIAVVAGSFGGYDIICKLKEEAR